jgi:hypothetical protein
LICCVKNNTITVYFKARRFYSELIESFKRTDIILGSTEPANYRGAVTFDLIETMYNSAFHKYRSVLATKALIIIGLVIIILGIIFLLQSESSLGPSTSFMYSNPEWTVNGYIIIAMGFIVIGVGVITRQYSKKHS